MIDKRVKDAIFSIVEQERGRSSANWQAIEIEASAAIEYINENNIEVDNLVYHFLEDTDARRKSEVYALHQTTEVLKMLDQ